MTTILATETWTGTDGSAWPAQWTIVSAGTATSATIQSNQGQLNSGTAVYGSEYADLTQMTTSANQDLFITITAMPASSSATISLCIDADGQYGYSLSLYTYGGATGGFYIQRTSAGTGTSLVDFQSIPLEAGSYYVRFQVINGVVKFKYWLTSASEPTGWTATATDVSPLPPGKMSLSAQYISGGTSNSSVNFDNLTLTDGAAAAVVASESWTGTNGDAWPAQWTTGSNYGTATSATIQANQGQLNFGTTVYGSVYALLSGMPNLIDTDLTVTIPILPPQGTTLISIRATADGVSSADYGYTLMLYSFGSGIGAYELVRSSGANTGTDIIAYTSTSLPNVSYKVRLQAVGGTVQFKIWASSGSEPASWTASGTDAAPVASGRVRLGFVYTDTSTANTVMAFDDLSVTGSIDGTNPPSAPLIPQVYLGTQAISTIKIGGYNVDAIYIGLNKVYPYSTTPSQPISVAMPTGTVITNGTTWVPSYSQDFTTPAALGTVTSTYSAMGYYSGFTDTSGQGLYSPDKVLSVHDSLLDAYVHSENGQPLVAAVMPDAYTPHTFGRFSMRYKTTANGTGYKFVGLYWPSSDTWNDGEIDWPEADLTAYSRPATAVPGSYNTTQPNNMVFVPDTTYYPTTDTSNWHISTTEWTSTSIKFYWDGVLVYELKDAAKIPQTAMRITLQMETFINEGTVPTASDGHILIDWVVIYNPQ